MSRPGVVLELRAANARPLIRAAATLAPLFDFVIGGSWPTTRWLGGTPFFFEGEDVALRLLSAAKVTGVEMLILEASAGPGASRLFGDHIPTQPLHCNATSR